MQNPSHPPFNGYALLIGVGNYPHVSALPVTANDAQVLHDILTDPDRAAYPKENVRLLTHEAASKAAIINGLEWLKTCTDKDETATALVYFSGHGGLIEDEYHLIPYEFSFKTFPDTAIPKQVFADAINALQPQKLLVILDCCHAGGFTTKDISDGLTFKATNKDLYEILRQGTGRVVAASSRAEQKSLIIGNDKYSVFTSALVNALDWYGDNGDGYARIFKTFSHVSSAVKRNTNERQVPIYNMEQFDDFAICRINKTLSEKSPFIPGTQYDENKKPAKPDQQSLMPFKMTLVQLLDKNGIAAIPEVLGMIENAGYTYTPSTLANLRMQAASPMAVMMPDAFIMQVKAFIQSIH
jgi:hypothetical protein